MSLSQRFRAEHEARRAYLRARRHQAGGPTLGLAPRRQTRQLGSRINEETLDAFEDWRDAVVSLARTQGRAKPSHGELVELALKRLMLATPREILG